MCCEAQFLQRLRERGLRLTPQREMVLRALHEVDSHATAEEIYARVSVQSAAVDLSTVYRTVELLQDLRLLSTIELADGQRAYELIGVHGPHHHLQCRRCGGLSRIEPEAVRPLIETLRLRYGFAAEPDHLVIAGLCQACREGEEREAQSAA
ncbi:MAG: transcriptional repressor [Anaerolineae bacterium]|nr:transcriptional repressor [Anaerolineae bacterium]